MFRARSALRHLALTSAWIAFLQRLFGASFGGDGQLVIFSSFPTRIPRVLQRQAQQLQQQRLQPQPADELADGPQYSMPRTLADLKEHSLRRNDGDLDRCAGAIQ